MNNTDKNKKGFENKSGHTYTPRPSNKFLNWVQMSYNTHGIPLRLQQLKLYKTIKAIQEKLKRTEQEQIIHLRRTQNPAYAKYLKQQSLVSKRGA